MNIWATGIPVSSIDYIRSDGENSDNRAIARMQDRNIPRKTIEPMRKKTIVRGPVKIGLTRAALNSLSQSSGVCDSSSMCRVKLDRWLPFISSSLILECTVPFNRLLQYHVAESWYRRLNNTSPRLPTCTKMGIPLSYRTFEIGNLTRMLMSLRTRTKLRKFMMTRRERHSSIDSWIERNRFSQKYSWQINENQSRVIISSISATVFRYLPSMVTDCCCFQIPWSASTPYCFEHMRDDPPPRPRSPRVSYDQNGTFKPVTFRGRVFPSRLSILYLSWISTFTERELKENVRHSERADRIWPHSRFS
jgi:hypothetical protein